MKDSKTRPQAKDKFRGMAAINYAVQGLRGGECLRKRNVSSVSIEADAKLVVSASAVVHNMGDHTRLTNSLLTIVNDGVTLFHGTVSEFIKLLRSA